MTEAKTKPETPLDDDTEMTLRADVKGERMLKVKLPDAVEVTPREALEIAAWARSFAGTCLVEGDVHVSDIKPSTGTIMLAELHGTLPARLEELFAAANRYAFGIRLMRDDMRSPYQMSITRRIVDAPMLTVPMRSFRNFMIALVPVTTAISEGAVPIDAFGKLLEKRYAHCMDAGCAHYQAFARRIVAYGKAHGAQQVIWGPERRGTGR